MKFKVGDKVTWKDPIHGSGILRVVKVEHFRGDEIITTDTGFQYYADVFELVPPSQTIGTPFSSTQIVPWGRAETTKALVEQEEREAKLQAQVIKPFRGEQRCQCKEEPTRRVREDGPHPMWDSPGTARQEASMREIKAWVGRNFREYPYCGRGGSVELGFGWQPTDRPGGKYMYGFFQCTKCDV